MQPACAKYPGPQARLWAMFLFFLVLNVLTWAAYNTARAAWGNTPPAPGVHGLTLFALGDPQLAYRGTGIMLQNLGNTGGNSRSLKDYNYDALGDWLLLADRLDPRANFMPFLAAYYFGALDDPVKILPVVDYLEIAGNRPGNNKWAWLAQAVYLARYVMKDLNRAYVLAGKLAALDDPTVPPWGRQMPAFVLTAQGDKADAYAILVEILKSSADKLPPQEINAIKDYICKRTLAQAEAAANPLCKDAQ